MLIENQNQGKKVLEARGICKRFPGCRANEQINFTIKKGEVHAILGENGAGKTTLMNVLFGLYQPDEGELYFNEVKVNFRSPLDALEKGIGMVHQKRKLVTAHSVIENIILGHPRAGKILSFKKAKREVAELCEKYGFNIDLDAKIWQLSEGQKQSVEIIKALYRGAEVLILDEPTSALSPPETRNLLDSIRSMVDNNLAVVPFITHKLPIVLEISDRVTVLCNGKVTAQFDTAGATEKSLAKSMVGREVIVKLDRVKVERGKPVLEVNNLSAYSEKEQLAFKDVSFKIHEGEIFGIAGVSGNGQEELAEVLAGIRKTDSGTIFLNGKNITHDSTLERWRKGVGYIPAERNEVGSIGDYSLIENVAMNYYFEDEYVPRGIIDYKSLRELTQSLIDEYNVAASGPDVVAKTLSGGNLQKLILARVLSRNPRLIIASLPTQGLDVGAIEFVQNKLLQAKKDKVAILLISGEIDEAIALSDWIAPIYEGKLMDLIPWRDADRDKVGAMMAGIKPKVESI
ncbi:MAG: ABC transporter ATP-binding protein [Bacillota bacterium]